MNPQAENSTRPHRNLLWLLPPFLLIVMLAIVTATVMSLHLAERIGQTGGKRHNAADFASDVERIAFVQQFSPLKIPHSATEFTIEQDPANAGYRQATFVVSPDDFTVLADKLNNEHTLDGEGTFKLDGPLSDNDQTSFKLDAATRRVEVNYFDP